MFDRSQTTLRFVANNTKRFELKHCWLSTLYNCKNISRFTCARFVSSLIRRNICANSLRNKPKQSFFATMTNHFNSNDDGYLRSRSMRYCASLPAPAHLRIKRKCVYVHSKDEKTNNKSQKSRVKIAPPSRAAATHVDWRPTKHSHAHRSACAAAKAREKCDHTITMTMMFVVTLSRHRWRLTPIAIATIAAVAAPTTCGDTCC